MRKEIESIINNQVVSFISSIDKDGYPAVKGMLLPRRIEELKVIYFSTNTSSQKVDNFINDPRASIYFCDNPTFKGINFLGTIEVLKDDESKKTFWQEGDELFYPLGVTDPDYCVLKFTTESVRCYSNFKSTSYNIDELL